MAPKPSLRYTTRSYQDQGALRWQVVDSRSLEVLGSDLSRQQARRWVDRLNAMPKPVADSQVYP